MTRILLALALALAAPFAAADVLLIDEVRQSENMQLPTNGITKAQTEAKYGTPNKKLPAVGDPPITRWEYERFNVYFEYDLVLFSVLNPGEVIEK
jgi:hypothetical protein